MAVKLSTIFKMELSLFSTYYTHPEIQVCRTDSKELEGALFPLFARHGRALTGVSPEHAQIVGSV